MQNEIVEDLENYKANSNEQLDILIAKYSGDIPPEPEPCECVDGKDGTDGAKGDQGEQGIQGEQGEPGTGSGGDGNTKFYKVIPSDFDFNNIPTNYANCTWVIRHNHDLGGSTINIPNNVTLNSQGGKLSNGTLKCDNTSIVGVRLFDKTIILKGSLKGQGVEFDWFDTEMSTIAQYNKFINRGGQGYGEIPNISDANSTILQMILDGKFSVQFGQGIYAFDKQIERGFRSIKGYDKQYTLLWFPLSTALYADVGSTYATIDNLTIESKGECMITIGTAVYHGLNVNNATFVSYEEDTFKQESGLIYGSKWTNVQVFAGIQKSCFSGLSSGSNVYHNVVDMHLFYSRIETTKSKGTIKAMFYNSSCRAYTDSNNSYAGMDYLLLIDAYGMFSFTAYNNVFESQETSWQAITKVDTANFTFNFYDNNYIDLSGGVDPSPRENGYQHIFLGGNNFIKNYPQNIYSYGINVGNQSNNVVRNITPKIDANKTRYRLEYLEPNSSRGEQSLLPPTQENADKYGFSEIYEKDKDSISYILLRTTDVI